MESNNIPLYNSRIVRNYTEYLSKYHQDVDVEEVLRLSGISTPELNDHGHWFSQSQVNRFHEVLNRKTNDHDLPRKVGRYYASSEGLGAARQYILGMLNVPTGYRLMGKAYGMFSRTMTFQSQNQKKNYIELVFTPKREVTEKPFQCQNRLGAVESLAQLFTGKRPEIDHPYCIHKGDTCCQYNVTWQFRPIAVWNKILQYSLPILTIAGAGAYFLLPFFSWLSFILAGSTAFTIAAFLIANNEKQHNQLILRSQGDAEAMLLNETNARYDNALLIQNIGKAAAALLKESDLINQVAGMMKSHLDFNRGIIFLLDSKQHALVPEASYGFSATDTNKLSSFRIDLNNPPAGSTVFKAHTHQKTQLLGPGEKTTLGVDLEKGAKELICTPILFDGTSLGVICLDSLKTRRPLTQSDEHLINGIAHQLAVSIVNARAYIKIADSENRYRLIADNAGDAIWLMDARTLQYTYMSPAIEKILGYKPDHFYGKTIDLTLSGAAYRHLKTVLSTEFNRSETDTADADDQTHMVTAEQNHLNGHSVWTEITVKPLSGATSSPTILGITRDISQRVKAEQQKRLLEDQLRVARKMEAIGKFAGGIAHDFNNILNVVVLNAEMGKESEDNDVDGKNYSFEQVLDSGKRARNLIRQLLVFTKGQPEKQQALCLAACTRDTLKIIKSMISETITLEQHLPCQELPVYADPTQIQQVIINLCVNAAQSMAAETDGRIEVSMESFDADTLNSQSLPMDNATGWIKLSVSDTGCGIHQKDLEKIFDPFFTTKGETDGTGLGLSIVHEIILNSNGHIDVESQPGQGTVFHVFLPKLYQAPGIKDKKTPSEKGATKLLKGSEHILLVDDEQTVLQATERLLKNLGYTITAVDDSRTALEHFTQNLQGFDAVVTDMTMPHLTGLDLCEQIKLLRKDIPLIICTGHSDQLSPEQASEAGITYIAKPFKIREIASAIRDAIDLPDK
ncbi:MAG: ATP-binding protein [Thermodesulfobacteriota bacterium]|nr:ATP-binding protein [Thermodesulfobacteriota bacterium]